MAPSDPGGFCGRYMTMIETVPARGSEEAPTAVALVENPAGISWDLAPLATPPRRPCIVDDLDSRAWISSLELTSRGTRRLLFHLSRSIVTTTRMRTMAR